MAKPSSDELLDAIELIREVQGASDLEAYRKAVLGISRLVDGIQVGYNEVDVATGELTFLVIEPPDAFGPPGLAEEMFSRWAHQHPLLHHHQSTGDPSPIVLSDFLGEAEFHGLGLYKELYSRVGAEDQISFMLPSPRGQVIAMAINRDTRGFSERDRTILDLVRPHLGQAFRDAQMRESVDPISDARLEALGLTPREAEVMRLLVDGQSAAEVGAELHVSVHTARNHIASIYTRLGVNSRAAAVASVLRHDA